MGYFILHHHTQRIMAEFRTFLVTLALTAMAWTAYGQQAEADHSYKPLKIDLDDSGTKYLRFIIWHQQWITTSNLASGSGPVQLNHMARRSRVLAYAQISPRFLILTHFGLNNLTTGNLTSLGNNGDGPQMFLHDAWTEYKVSDELYLGGGLHYWKGLNRLANQSTLNFMTLDNTRPFVHWHSLGVTDQFARHLGMYAKGKIGKLDYRLAWNNPGRNGFQSDRSTAGSGLTYNGFAELNKDGDPVGNSIFEGYFKYELMDSESTKLPYMVGTYLGKKKIFALGAGFFAHPNGMYNTGTGDHESVFHFAADAFLDMPLGDDDCLNAYASFMSFNYGENYVSRWAGTGTVLYAQAGYLLPATKFMPYVAFQSGSYEGYDYAVTALDIGVNYFINGHHAKLTLEYHQLNDPRDTGFVSDQNGNITGFGDLTQLRLQAHIFL